MMNSRIKALQKELKQLTELLIKKDLEKLVDDNYLKVVATKLGYKNVLELKKTKHLALLKSSNNNPVEKPYSIKDICKEFSPVNSTLKDKFYPE